MKMKVKTILFGLFAAVLAEGESAATENKLMEYGTPLYAPPGGSPTENGTQYAKRIHKAQDCYGTDMQVFRQLMSPEW